MRTFLSLSVIGFLLVLSPCSDLHAQGSVSGVQNQTSIGVRFGGTTGVTVKHFYRPTNAVEGLLGSFGNGFSITALFEKYQPVYNAPGLHVFYGGGMHLAVYNGQGSERGFIGHEVAYHPNNDAGLGIDGILGIEYRLPENVPLTINFTLKPFIEFGSAGFMAGGMDPGIGISYTIPKP